MNNQERQALIEYCESVISAHEQHGGDCDEERVYRIALAALTAEPVAWEVRGILCHTKEEADKYVGTPVPLIESLIDNTAQQYEALGKGDKC